MQPLPPAISPTATTGKVANQPPYQTNQHGQLPHPVGSGQSPAAEYDAYMATGADSTPEESLSSATEGTTTQSFSRRERLTGDTSARLSHAGKRVDEYEKASTPPMRRRERLAFEVIKSERADGDKRCSISELPNEVLTHILAHLSPSDLATVSLVSRRFHSLVTTPHAWRSAFSRYFPGPDSIHALEKEIDDDSQAITRSERRVFTRLTPLATWRSEYILRTRLLRSLGRGKPIQPAGSSNTPNASRATSPFVTYNSQLISSVNHLHATFGIGPTKRSARFIHAADDVGTASSSDPAAGKVDRWGQSDPEVFLQFSERFPGDTQYGLGPGEIVGGPNIMDVSQPYGMIHGEGSPGGLVYHRSTDEMRGRFLLGSSGTSVPNDGIPKISSANEAICCVWVARSSAVPALTDGLVGMFSGSSMGVLSTYSLGSSSSGHNRNSRFGRGELTARWVLSPGVPLIAIAVDNEYNLGRHAQNRIWAVVLNALGEVFYLTKFPTRPRLDQRGKLAEEHLAWLTGRSVYWNVVEKSRRTARPDPYNENQIDGSYSPRSSWNGMCLSKEQISAETHEIETFAAKKPKSFQQACYGWDMQRKLEADFANEDEHHAGEAMVVIDCGLPEGATAAVKRYTRVRFQEISSADRTSMSSLTSASTPPSTSPSLFGGSRSPALAQPSSLSLDSLELSLAHDEFSGSITPRPICEEWRVSEFAFGMLKNLQILASAIDNSAHAIQTNSEDPLLSFSGRSTASSPSITPMSPTDPVSKPADVPGQRARLMAVGTNMGSVIVWDMRSPSPKSSEIVNKVDPIRILHTDSPQISCLALSSLYLVHGGNDGLVQAWDPLASDAQPVRTLNSRFSSRARRRLVQAQASPRGVGINLFAAHAICLDPDPTVLRGVVSLGTLLLYWAYSSSSADHYRSHKRRLRRSERGSNNGGERFSGVARSNIKNYIASEKFELEQEKVHRQKEAERFAGRFGTNLLDGSEEEMVAYAAMLSQESHEQENKRRASDTASATNSTATSSGESVGIWSSDDTATPAGSPSAHASSPKVDEHFDADLAEAIRQSLAPSPVSHVLDVPIRQAKPKGKQIASSNPSPRSGPLAAASTQADEMSDLDFAIQLSLAEEASKAEGDSEKFPVLTPSGKGKKRQL